MKAWIEAPEGWAARQILLTRLEKMGYRVELSGIGQTWRMVLH